MPGNRADLKENAAKVFDTYLVNGFSPAGFFKEFVDYRTGYEETVFSIRRQSEGIYAIFHYLDFEKRNGRKHPEWEAKVRKMLDVFLQLQNPEGSFPRKFKDDLSIVDKSGGSTPSATLPLVMGYKYFKDKRYLESAKRTAEYLEKELISKMVRELFQFGYLFGPAGGRIFYSGIFVLVPDCRHMVLSGDCSSHKDTDSWRLPT